jgi:hypothetical protein
MRTPREIYTEYKIMPSLQLHQLRVTAVAKLICDNFAPPTGGLIATNDIILACLFHDMGNIVKFDLAYFPEFLEPEGLAYWQAVKEDFIARYGGEQHDVNEAIAREMGLPGSIVQLIAGIRFSKLSELAKSDFLEQKVCQYADMRVGPHGVLTMQERIDEAHTRYAGRRTEEEFHVLVSAAQEVERQIFSYASIAPTDITNASVAPVVEELREYPVA